MSDDFVAWASVGVTFVVVVVLLILLLLLWRRYPGPQQARGVKFDRREGDVELSDADAVLDRANAQMSDEETASAAARAAALREVRNPASREEGRDEAAMGTRRQLSKGPSQSTAEAREEQVRGAVQSGVFIAGVDTANGAVQNADLGALGDMPHAQRDSQPMTPEGNWVDGETQD